MNAYASQIDSNRGLEVSKRNTSGPLDYWKLTKPNVMRLVVFTGGVGLLIAPGSLHPLLAGTAVLSIAGGAAASAAINNAYDADIDQEMARTRLRPTATGKISADSAFSTGLLLACISIMAIGLATNWLAAGILAFTIFFYCVVYTMGLKRSTPQNIVIGGAAGALPPVIGWAAVEGSVGLLPLILFLIVFVWTPPHFWALALYRTKDYEKVSVPMLPVVSGRAVTINHILVYSVLLAICAMLPVMAGLTGFIYGSITLISSIVFVYYAVQLKKTGKDREALKLFKFSIFYLFLIFTAVLADSFAGQVF